MEKNRGGEGVTLENSIYIMQGVFDDMDKDFTIWEYKDDIKELLKCGYFVRHIINHFKSEHPEWKAHCKICDMDIDTINEKERCNIADKIIKFNVKRSE